MSGGFPVYNMAQQLSIFVPEIIFGSQQEVFEGLLN